MELMVILIIGFVFRILLAGFKIGHVSDLGCFISWADRMVDTGCASFYSSEVFTDYPPGYMYILWLIGLVREWLGLGAYTFANLVLMKLPAILCDLGTGYFIYQLAVKKEKKLACFAILLFLFNPAVFINSAIWGQVDSIFTLCIVMVCYLVTVRKLPAAYFVFALGILIKPQTLIFTPVILYGVWDRIWQGKFSYREFSKQCIYALGAVIFLLFGMVPFGVDTVLTQYVKTMTSYPYATVNGYNLWNLFGLNWHTQNEVFMGLSYSKWGSLSIFLTVILATIIWIKGKAQKEIYFISAGVIMGGMFLFSVRMHERYLYPILILLLGAYVIQQQKKWLVSYLFFSLGHYLNVAHVLYKKEEIPGFSMPTAFISLILIGAYGYFLYSIYEELKGKTTLEKITLEKTAVEKTEQFKKNQLVEEKYTPFGKKDVIALLLITLCYGVIAFYDLGEQKAPESFCQMEEPGQTMVFDFGTSTYLTDIYFYLGNLENREFTLEVSEEAEGPYFYVTDVKLEQVFAWNFIRANEKGQYWRLTLNSDKAVIGEMVFYDFDGNITTPVEILGEGKALLDEPKIFSGRSSFRNSTYFDEIYHARTAYEYLNGLYSYENTHPPLGKILIAAGMKLWGVNPFGWRFMGTLFGVLMIPCFYLFTRSLLRNTLFAAGATIWFAFDFMHFVQTRIATIDVFVTFFILLMYYFMYEYLRTEKYGWLGACGVTMGFAIASKWTGVYGGAGLAVLFFAHWWLRYKEAGQLDNIREYQKKFLKTVAFCLVFFVTIPLVIYILSYLPFVDGTGRGLLSRMLDNQVNMFSYHSKVEATHPFSSWWYQWPTMYRPIWYYSGTITDQLKEGISAFGNPLIWWTGIPAFFYCAYLMVMKKDKRAGFLVTAYLAQYLPWFFVTRITFIYHYFPSVPFVVLMIGYGLKQFSRPEEKLGQQIVIVYTGIAIGIFVLFYPVLSGHEVSTFYVEHFLRWFDSWVLI